MKWRHPQHNEIRLVTRFAWWPVRCDDGFTRWLEFVDLQQRYVDGARFGMEHAFWLDESTKPARGR